MENKSKGGDVFM